jgi:hypothetical protein
VASGTTAILTGGRANSVDCPAKFSGILHILNTARQVHLRDGFSLDQSGFLKLIYGLKSLLNDLLSSYETCIHDFDKQPPETEA